MLGSKSCHNVTTSVDLAYTGAPVRTLTIAAVTRRSRVPQNEWTTMPSRAGACSYKFKEVMERCMKAEGWTPSDGTPADIRYINVMIEHTYVGTTYHALAGMFFCGQACWVCTYMLEGVAVEHSEVRTQQRLVHLHRHRQATCTLMDVPGDPRIHS